MLRRYIPRALATPTRGFTTSSVLSRRQRYPIAGRRKDTKARHGKQAKESADSQQEGMPLPGLENLNMEHLSKMLNQLGGGEALDQLFTGGAKSKSESKATDGKQAKGSAASADSQREHNPMPDIESLHIERMHKMLNRLKGGSAEEASDPPSTGGAESKSKSKATDGKQAKESAASAGSQQEDMHLPGLESLNIEHLNKMLEQFGGGEALDQLFTGRAKSKSESKATEGKKAKGSAASADSQQEDMPLPGLENLNIEHLNKMLEQLGGVEALDQLFAGEAKSKSKSGYSMFGDGTSKARKSPKPNLLDPDDPLGLKGAKPGPAMFSNNMDPESIFEFYEQDWDDKTGATRRPMPQSQMQVDESQREELAAKIKRLEREMRDSQRDDPLLRINETLKAIARDELLTEPISLLGDADPAEINAAMDELRIPVPKTVRDMAASGDKGPRSAAAINAGQRLVQLNNALRHAYLATDDKKRPTVRAVLWKAYKSAKLRVPDLLPQIPPAAWDMLFYSQAVRWNRRRDACMAELLADMRRLGMDGPPTPPPEGKALPDFGDADVQYRGGRRKRPGRRGTWSDIPSEERERRKRLRKHYAEWRAMRRDGLGASHG